mmetsp:Transcript_6771/g.16827  ORF Transcript_6771/g.16827 Transcript_6771/m.16827 type:complete len:315 (+) Transcript_6771:385-1329(+)
MIPGNTAASTIAARTALGVGASTALTCGKANNSVVIPHTKPINGDDAPVSSAIFERLREPPMGALPHMPDVMQPRPWPASSVETIMPSFGEGQERMARKSTEANAATDRGAATIPPRRSTTAEYGMSQGQRLTQPKKSPATPPGMAPALAPAVALDAVGGMPTTLPRYCEPMANNVPTASATMTSTPSTRKARLRPVFARSTTSNVSALRPAAAGSQRYGCSSVHPSWYMADAPPEIDGGTTHNFFTLEPPASNTAPEVWAPITVIAKPSFQPCFTDSGMCATSRAAPDEASKMEATPTITEYAPNKSSQASIP